MSSAQQSPTTCSYSDEVAQYERQGLPVPVTSRVKKLPEYQDWVAKGGLEKFAAAHNIEPDFMARASEVDIHIVFAFYANFQSIPGLENIMAPERAPPRSIAELDTMPQKRLGTSTFDVMSEYWRHSLEARQFYLPLGWRIEDMLRQPLLSFSVLWKSMVCHCRSLHAI
jgi:hypothetical protein